MQMFLFQLILSLGFVGQWWYGCVGGDLCGGFWLIWVLAVGVGGCVCVLIGLCGVVFLAGIFFIFEFRKIIGIVEAP